jgi:hypothetical protein
MPTFDFIIVYYCSLLFIIKTLIDQAKNFRNIILYSPVCNHIFKKTNEGRTRGECQCLQISLTVYACGRLIIYQRCIE